MSSCLLSLSPRVIVKRNCDHLGVNDFVSANKFMAVECPSPPSDIPRSNPATRRVARMRTGGAAPYRSTSNSSVPPDMSADVGLPDKSVTTDAGASGSGRTTPTFRICYDSDDVTVSDNESDSFLANLSTIRIQVITDPEAARKFWIDATSGELRRPILNETVELSSCSSSSSEGNDCVAVSEVGFDQNGSSGSDSDPSRLVMDLAPEQNCQQSGSSPHTPIPDHTSTPNRCLISS